ncbi:MAG: methylated-DNA--[protein]-cysteine S-methyltransferase, partial [Acidimicrobiia bacterium]|nr:methylated-DNA--[protein]-cysteine S-methyltransferase [Acidimicrobiia bacterium]
MTDIPARLAALREPAPTHLVPEVLGRLGLAARYVTLPSALGPVFVAFTNGGVSRVDLADDPERFAAAYRQRFGREVAAAVALPPRLAAAVDRALAHGRTRGVPVDPAGLSEFQAAVLQLAASIPPGEVRPYGWVAREIGRPGSDRAVGNALAGNPVPLVVPCHRVVRADGRFGRYSLGADQNKRLLLGAEGLAVEEYEALAGRGVRYLGSDTTGIYCHPTCRHARRITAKHRVEFCSSAEAARAGFRPCR